MKKIIFKQIDNYSLKIKNKLNLMIKKINIIHLLIILKILKMRKMKLYNKNNLNKKKNHNRKQVMRQK